MKIWLAVLVWASSLALGRGTKNILVTGFWPPTNSMMTRFSTKASLNPQGWLGKNFEGSGYDVHAYFPTFPKGGSIGEGDFRVDFAAAFNDFMKYTGELHPIAIVSFGYGGWEWEMEERAYPYHFTEFFVSGDIPSEVGVKVQYSIPESLKEKRTYDTTLPFELIQSRVNALPGKPIQAWVDSKDGAGDFLCGFLTYLGAWYHAEHSQPNDPYPNKMSGFIHVRGTLEKANPAFLATLRAIIESKP